ncbi:single-stranded DNA-binding protein [Pseudomonas phage vB_PaeS_SCUT-S3]|uniref:Single-stranded DNA-binding protein n=1 Tax=Pseudomonas phage vB_PaeS_SCUT-S3 TaxID=2382122 RepID=A0A3Q8KUR7_9CAUD|nr:single-stranded DNA-binding protein [Pseudomonas phage vB_PaeS_SCUT-S3]AZF90039.1 single-stranded DNA-binding protein [Pseudomonas phage vB_PaeS_SCUT-S3]
MQLIQAFNAQQYDPTQGVGSLPIGKHPVIVESSEVKANKANDGGYLQLNLRIIDGPQQGTTGAYRLNLYHSNQQTVEIAHRQLSAICHVIGVFQVTDSSQLHNLPFLIEVGPQKNDPQYTEVKKVFDMNGNEPGKAGAGAPAAQPQQQQPQGQPNGAWGGAPQGQPNGAWGGAPQGQPQQPAQNPAPQGGQPAWGGQPAQQPAQQQPQGGGWQQGGQPAQGGAPAGAAPWGQR